MFLVKILTASIYLISKTYRNHKYFHHYQLILYCPIGSFCCFPVAKKSQEKKAPLADHGKSLFLFKEELVFVQQEAECKWYSLVEPSVDSTQPSVKHTAAPAHHVKGHSGVCASRPLKT